MGGIMNLAQPVIFEPPGFAHSTHYRRPRGENFAVGTFDAIEHDRVSFGETEQGQPVHRVPVEVQQGRRRARWSGGRCNR